jgi:antitoxin HigA-1
MIVNYRDKRTERFARGERVKEFSGFSRQAETGSTGWKPQITCRTLQHYLETGSRRSKATERANTLSASMTGGGYALNGRRDHQARLTSNSPTIIDENRMVRTAIHPGEHLAEELTELGISAAELSRQIEVPVNRVTSIINGERGITADTALRLGHWFGTSAEFWLNLQKLYELRKAQLAAGDTIRRLPRRTGRKQNSERAPPLTRSKR